MRRAARDALSDRAIWLLIGGVFLCVVLVLVLVFHHEKNKPNSPQALVAAAFNLGFPIKEWQPGMGKKPFMYHPAGFEKLVWWPLPLRPRRLGPQTNPSPWPQHRVPYNQWNRYPMAGVGQSYGRGQPEGIDY